MKNLSKDKRRKLILLGLATIAVLGGIWFGVIRAQQAKLNSIASRKNAARTKLLQIQKEIALSDTVEAQLGDAGAKLAKFEETMASGDLYSWSINTLRQFKLPYRVDIPQFSQIDGPREVPVFADFPYRQASLSIGGTANYYDFGRFIADFENQFPFVRIMNLTLEPASANASGSNEQEKLSFKLDIVSLVKPGTT